MDKGPDLQKRLNALSIPELRTRVDRVVGHLREIRTSMAVHAAMTLERAPEVVPPIHAMDVQEALDLMIELLPVLRAPLSPEEKKALYVPSSAEKKALDEAMEAMAQMNPEVFNQIAKEAGLDAVHADVVLLQEAAQKMEMLGDVTREIQAFEAELRAYQDKLLEHAAATQAMLENQGPKGPATN